MSRMLGEVRAQAERKEGTEEVTRKRKMLISVGVVLVAVTVLLVLFLIDRAERIYPTSGWIRIDKEQYFQGEKVRSSFINLTEGTVVILDHGIKATRIGVLGVEFEDVYNVIPLGMRFPLVGPGETYTWTWDQTYANVRNGPPIGTQVPPGRYIVYWVAYEAELHEVTGHLLLTGATVGYFRQWFEITAGKD